MDRLKFEKWWATDDQSAPNPKEYAWQAWQAAISNQSLSQEAVRDEALELRRLVKLLAELAITESEIEQEFMHGPRVIFEKGGQIAVRDVLMARKALKREPNASYSELGRDDDAPRRDFEREQYERAEREPNAAAQASGSSEHTMASANPAPAAPVAEMVRAAREMDWMQVVLNGGPPCFHLQEDGRFCGRAERWDGHDGDPHNFVSLAALLARLGQGWVPQGIPIGQCCCRAHHPNYGRCLQCPIHGTATARSLR